MPFWMLLTDWGGGLPKIYHTYRTMMKLGSYTLPKEDAKNMNQLAWPLSPADISIFFSGNEQIFLYQEIQTQIAFWDIFPNSFNFRVFKDCLNKHVTILMMSRKLATLGLLKIKLFWNKGYGVIISVHDVSNKIS